jgi:hypothetical protein
MPVNFRAPFVEGDATAMSYILIALLMLAVVAAMLPDASVTMAR